MAVTNPVGSTVAAIMSELLHAPPPDIQASSKVVPGQVGFAPALIVIGAGKGLTLIILVEIQPDPVV